MDDAKCASVVDFLKSLAGSSPDGFTLTVKFAPGSDFLWSANVDDTRGATYSIEMIGDSPEDLLLG